MKKYVPKTNVTAGSVQDLINQMRGDSGAFTNDSVTYNDSATTNEVVETTEPTKKGVVPKAIVSVDPEIQRMREILSSGREAVIDSDGTISDAHDSNSTSTTKAKTVPKAIVSTGETENRGV